MFPPKLLRRRFLALFTLVLLWIVACQPQPETPEISAPPPPAAQSSVFLNGAGATFPIFLYQRWFSDFNRDNPNIQINYQPVGSAAGIQQMIAETVDFGASDIAMSDEDMAKVQRGVVLIPMTAGSVAIAYNVPGVETGLKLSREVLPEIFLGKITRWNAPKLAALNPDVTLPDLPILAIHRSDGSGTTAVFTSHLSAISPQWQKTVGSGLNVAWPSGTGIKSNEGVSAQIQQSEGTIGYVEFSYAQQLGLATAALENNAGQYVQPAIASAEAGLASVQLPDNLRAFIPDPEGDEAYPIVTYTWILAYEQYNDPNKAEALKAVLRWSLTKGQQLSEELGYVPLPAEVSEKAVAALDRIAG